MEATALCTVMFKVKYDSITRIGLLPSELLELFIYHYSKDDLRGVIARPEKACAQSEVFRLLKHGLARETSDSGGLGVIYFLEDQTLNNSLIKASVMILRFR